ncbi:MAG TPA: hypothetical protein VMB84_01230, partial [Stellaceae bacterium]|nr:hypothetical protein [Stellaceae bacterium]
GGSLVNLGVITGGGGGSVGFGPGGPSGIGASATGGVLTNGTVGGDSALIQGSVGFVGYGTGATVVNYGTIAGFYGTAVSLQSGDTLVIEAGSTLVGAAVGNGGTLAWGGAGGPGTITGLGSEYSGFSHYAVLAGADWTLTGTQTIPPGAALTDAGTLAVYGDLSTAATVTRARSF